MRILVTGGAGFLGSALANRLAEEGHQVRVLDDLSAGDRTRLGDKVAFSTGDVRDVPKLWTLLNGVDCVYHLAARVSVPESVLYPVEYNSVNVGGTVSLLTAIRDAHVQRLIFASSGAVYGEQARQPVHEGVRVRPDTPYAVSKVASEEYVRAIGRLWDIETCSLRIFNVYGPGQPLPASHAPVIPRFLRQAVTGGSLVLFGGGAQSRDFLYIDDAVEALVRAGCGGSVREPVLNVGSGMEVTISSLVDTIEQALGTDVHRLVNGEAEAGVSRLVADVGQAKRALGWAPTVGLLDGLRRTLAEDDRFRV